MTLLPAGKLDRRIRIERPTKAQSPSGEEVDAWVLVAEVWSWKRDASARERLASEQKLAERTTVFRIRFRRDVTSECRIVADDGLIFDISGIGEIGRRVGLELTATARGQSKV